MPRCDRVDVRNVKHVEIPVPVDQHRRLIWLLREGVITEHVVREVVDDFECQEETWRGHVRVPFEDGPVDDADFILVAPR